MRPTASATKPDPDVAADFLEPAAAVVAEEQLALRLLRAGPEVPRVVHDVPVHDAEVEIAVVVVVEKLRAEADVGQRLDADTALGRGLGEQTPGRGS